MTDAQECLKYAVGLVQVECSCLGTIDAESKRSDSGYYLDDMEIGPPLQYPKAVGEYCDAFWAMMSRARADGIRDFLSAFIVMSGKHNRIKVSPFDGSFVDEEDANLVLSVGKSHLVVKYTPKSYVRGAVWEIKTVGIMMNLAGSYTLNVYKHTDLTTPFKTQAINQATDNVLEKVTLAEKWELPLWYDNRIQSYYFVYDRGVSSPWNIKFNCGCTNGTKPWERYLQAKGMQTDDVTDLNTNSSSSSFSNGIYLHGSLTCDSFDWMCRDWNYKNNPFAAQMAKLIQLFTIRKLYALILNSTKINRYTLLDKNNLVKRIALINKMIEDPRVGNLPYLVREIPKGVTGCWECTQRFQKRSIFV